VLAVIFMKKQILLYLLSFFSGTSLLCQNCIVSIDSLKGQYIGECNKGKADGKGTAIGADSYTGYFKKGYPDGEGKYIWKNGSWYEGSWKNGLFEGWGSLTKITEIKRDSTVTLTGLWEKGKYIGKYEKPYVVRSLTNNINDISIRKLNSTESEITITVKSITGGASTLTNNAVLPKSRMVDIQIIEGWFEQKITDETSSLVTNKYIFRKVTYPFSAIISFETVGLKLPVERVEIQLFENANWYIQVNIDN
jgi:hypothetical protein